MNEYRERAKFREQDPRDGAIRKAVYPPDPGFRRRAHALPCIR